MSCPPTSPHLSPNVIWPHLILFVFWPHSELGFLRCDPRPFPRDCSPPIGTNPAAIGFRGSSKHHFKPVESDNNQATSVRDSPVLNYYPTAPPPSSFLSASNTVKDLPTSVAARPDDNRNKKNKKSLKGTQIYVFRLQVDPGPVRSCPHARHYLAEARG